MVLVEDKSWKILTPRIPQSDQELVQILLANRKIDSKSQEDFFNPDFKRFLDFELEGIELAFLRIQKAIQTAEKTVVFGDYDVDGICGAAILWETLNSLGADVLPYIPNRFKEGYGLSKTVVRKLAKERVKLIITVDLGVTAVEEVALAKKLGIDIVICDHHLKPEILPEAIIVHTYQLSGAGVALKLVAEILAKLGKVEEIFPKLDLAAIAAISDMIPMVGVNRTLVKAGFAELNRTTRVGLLALYADNRLTLGKIGVWEVAHILAPRLAAAGRMTDAVDSLRLLCTKNYSQAEKLASNLKKINHKRQNLTQRASGLAFKLVDRNSSIGIVHHQSFHQGVIGIVAARLVENFAKPAIVISEGKKISRGSARSLNGINITKIIKQAEDLLVEAGGHDAAAGFTIETDKISEFKERISQLAEKLDGQNFIKTQIIDCLIDDSQINFGLLEILEKFAPFGVGNWQPVFLAKKCPIGQARKVGATNSHLKLQIGGLTAVGFGMGDFLANLRPGNLVDIVFSLEKDSFDGSLVLKIKDLATLSDPVQTQLL